MDRQVVGVEVTAGAVTVQDSEGGSELVPVVKLALAHESMIDEPDDTRQTFDALIPASNIPDILMLLSAAMERSEADVAFVRERGGGTAP